MEIASRVKHEFNVSLNWNEATHNGTAQSGNRVPLSFSAPSEFGGSDNAWSPEHMLAASLSGCYTTTLFHFARMLKLDIIRFDLDIKMDVVKEGREPFTVTRFILRPHIAFGTLPPQAVIANLLSKAKRYCIISNSVKAEIVVEPQVTAA